MVVAAAIATRAEVRIVGDWDWRDGQQGRSLTIAQLRVLRLVAEGRTDRDIGHVLGISRHTVKRHLEHIRARLGTCNRTEATAEAIRRGLI